MNVCGWTKKWRRTTACRTGGRRCAAATEAAEGCRESERGRQGGSPGGRQACRDKQPDKPSDEDWKRTKAPSEWPPSRSLIKVMLLWQQIRMFHVNVNTSSFSTVRELKKYTVEGSWKKTQTIQHYLHILGQNLVIWVWTEWTVASGRGDVSV